MASIIQFTDAKVELNPAWLKSFDSKKTTALEQTGDSLLTDLIMSQTMPFDTGALQNLLTYIDYELAKDGTIRLISMGPYARRLYFNPDFNFRQDKNPHAGGRWLDPYLPGHSKGMFIPRVFAMHMKKLMGG